MKKFALILVLLAGCAGGYVRHPVERLERLKASASFCRPRGEEPGYINVKVPFSELSKLGFCLKVNEQLWEDDWSGILDSPVAPIMSVMGSPLNWVLCGEDAKVWLAVPLQMKKWRDNAVEFIARWQPRNGHKKPHLLRMTTLEDDYCIEIVGSEDAPRTDLEQSWANELAHIASRFDCPLAAQVHAAAAMRRIGKKPSPVAAGRGRPAWSEPSPFEFISGDAAIQQALMDNLMCERVKPAKREIDISELEPMKIGTHDWAKLAASRKVEIPNASAVCPADCFFLNFHDMNRALDFFEFISDWGASPLRFAALEESELPTKQRAMRLLALHTRWYHKYFYSWYIRSLTLLAGDFYMREMPDLALLFEPQPGKLESVSGLLLNSLKGAAKDAGLKVYKTSIEGVEVKYVESKSGTTRAWHAVAGGFVVRASSRGMMRRIIQAAKGSAQRLADEPDFRYMLAALPYGAQGYAFLSESFVRRLVSPRFKVSELRRTNCAANMRVVEAAVFAFNAEFDRLPRGTAELRKRKFISTSPVCPHGGSYNFLPDGRLRCSAHGTLNLLKSHYELKVEKVTKEEAERYKTFCEGYREYWRKYFDPVGISIAVSSGEVALDVMITPLTEGYKELLQYSGGRGEKALETGRFAAAMFAGLKRLATLTEDEGTNNELARWLGLEKPVLGCVEAGAILLVQDNNWETWVRRILCMYDYEWEQEHPEEVGKFYSELPLAGVVRVNDSKAAEKLLRRLHAKLKDRAGQQWAPVPDPFVYIANEMRIGPLQETGERLIFRLTPIERIHAEKERPFSIWVVLDGDYLFVSPNRPLLERLSYQKEKSWLVQQALGEFSGWHIGFTLDLQRMYGSKEGMKRGLVSAAGEICARQRWQALGALRYAMLCEPEKVFRLGGADLVRMGLLETEPGCPDGGIMLFEAALAHCDRHATHWYDRLLPEYYSLREFETASPEQRRLLLDPVYLPGGSRLRRLLGRIGAVSVALHLDKEHLRSRIWFQLR